MASRTACAAVLLASAFALAFASPAAAQQTHRNAFEADRVAWVKSLGDAPHDVAKHANTDQGAHGGARSEHLQLTFQSGSYQHYVYPLGKAPVTDEFAGSLWLKANRPGLQLLARVVFPNERDPKNLETSLTTLIRGDVYQNAGRWQRLTLGRAQTLVKQQHQLLQAQQQRQINATDAYVDQLVLNVFAGPGQTEVWIDDLEVGPVLGDGFVSALPTAPSAPMGRIPGPPSGAGGRAPVEFNGTHLLVGGKPFFIRGVRVTDTPLKVLAAAGFNTVFFEASATPDLYKEAADLGLWIVPHLPVLADDARFGNAEALASEARRLSDTEGVLFVHLGRNLSFEQAAPLQRAIQVVRQADPGRPLGGDVWDGLQAHSRGLNLVAIHRWPFQTSLEIPRYREWIEMRRRLANPGAYVWTWLQNHVPDAQTMLTHGQTGTSAFRDLVGPQPEQMRLLAYSALAAGVKGVAFWSDRFMADSHHGRDRLMAAALLNQELEMLEPLLAGVDEPPHWIETSNPDVKATVLRSPKGVLVLPIWQGRGAQYVPGQASATRLSFVAPQIPASMQAWEALPGEVRGLPSERVVGGTRVTLPEFGLTSAVVFTADMNLVVRFQEFVRNKRQSAAQWTYDMATHTYEKIAKIEQELSTRGVGVPQGPSLTSDARIRLDGAKRMWDNKLYSESYREAQRALRPLRVLMRADWDQAVKGLDAPVASPYALSYYTLPKHWELMDQLNGGTFSNNLLPGGDFESTPADPAQAWRIEEPTLDDVETIAIRVREIQGPVEMKAGGVPSTLDQPKEGQQCAMLQVKPKSRGAAPQALERTVLALSSPTLKLPPGTLVRVSAWIRIPAPLGATTDGALFYDSAGGEPLAVRLTEPTPWKRYALYRRVPSSGQINVTLALTGLGSVYFDDVRIEPLVGGAVPGNLVSNPHP